MLSPNHFLTVLCEPVLPSFQWTNGAFSLTRPTKYYWNKGTCLQKKRIQLPGEHGSRFIVLGCQFVCHEVMWKHFIVSQAEPSWKPTRKLARVVQFIAIFSTRKEEEFFLSRARRLWSWSINKKTILDWHYEISAYWSITDVTLTSRGSNAMRLTWIILK